MAIKLNSYILTDNVKNSMKKKLDDTLKYKREMGFTLCSSKDNIITVGGESKGDSERIEIDSGACEKNEKFLGGYHAHYKTDSNPSAEDLRYCGTDKVTCASGIDKKIICNVWKYEQMSLEENNKIGDSINRGIIKSENPKYQPVFDCIRDINPLFLGQKYIMDELDKELDAREYRIRSMKISHVPKDEITQLENDLTNDIKERNKFDNALKKRLKRLSKKYYNEVEIK